MRSILLTALILVAANSASAAPQAYEVSIGMDVGACINAGLIADGEFRDMDFALEVSDVSHHLISWYKTEDSVAWAPGVHGAKATRQGPYLSTSFDVAAGARFTVELRDRDVNPLPQNVLYRSDFKVTPALHHYVRGPHRNRFDNDCLHITVVPARRWKLF